jgi:anaerobic nitric oxide reductase transcription regulator
VQALELYHWPGNVRELEHSISRAAVKALSQGASRQDIITLTPQLLELSEPTAFGQNCALNEDRSQQALAVVNPLPTGMGLKSAVAHFQREMITAALLESDANWSDAARNLELDPSNLHKLATKLGLKPAGTRRELLSNHLSKQD